MKKHLSCVIMLIAAVSSVASQPPPRRAILVSFDGFSETPMRRYSDSTSSPALWAMFRNGACAASSRPAFPSVTPVGHATIYTGAYANVHGVAASASGKLPLPQTTILESVDGYSSAPLTAEPIWISAARQGKRVFSQMSTQSPAPPAYPDAWMPGPSPASANAREAAAAALRRPESAVLNIYNELISEARVFESPRASPTVATTWRGLDDFRGGASPRELSWAFGSEGDSLHALLGVRNGAPVAIVSATRDVARGVLVRPAPVDSSSPRNRPLARYFSEPLRIDLPRGRRTFVYARLFDLSRDLTRFTLYVSEARVVRANRPEVAAAYDDAVRGVPGNGSGSLMERGALGTEMSDGGDGGAEWRYLETAELLTRQFMRGTEFGWRTYRPELVVDYLPQPDEALHNWMGLADPSTPNVRPAVRARATAMLARAYILVDLHLTQLQRLASEAPGTLLFVTGEHGMRATWASFRPNILLRDAGFLVADASGQIDLSRTTAAMARGGWISVNRATRRDGIVPVDSVAGILGRVDEILKGARDSTGAPIVTATWRAGTVAGDSLGVGGPAGGDLYFGVRPGYYPSALVQGSVTAPAGPRGNHGFPSTERDMQPAFCALGADVTPRRYGVVRSIDIAPTVTAWLGIDPPANAQGRSLLSEIRR